WVSQATPGSDPKSKPLALIGGGSGRSTPPHVDPPSLEKYPRIGRRAISLEPATIRDGSDGSIAMLVSLCGPSSLLTSTLVPTLTLATLVLIEDRKDGEETTRYFAHHVGWVVPTRVWMVAARPTVPTLSTRTAVIDATARPRRMASPPSHRGQTPSAGVLASCTSLGQSDAGIACGPCSRNPETAHG